MTPWTQFRNTSTLKPPYTVSFNLYPMYMKFITIWSRIHINMKIDLYQFVTPGKLFASARQLINTPRIWYKPMHRLAVESVPPGSSFLVESVPNLTQFQNFRVLSVGTVSTQISPKPHSVLEFSCCLCRYSFQLAKPFPFPPYGLLKETIW